MDAASNNSVDDIRELREKVAYAPVSGRHKVYILDEAHMLSTAAWNAFLKTLEEPPPHTIFVLATTEANKVLPTVVDRCHRFDFGRPTVTQIASVLRRVADAEEISIPDEACALIARSATGSFRDALGTLEQLLAYSGSSIALEDVLAVLGAADADLLFGAVDAVAAGDGRTALLAAARLAESGRDIGRFFSDLEAHTRALLVVQTLGEVPPELQVTAEQDERLREQAARVGQTDVVRILDLIALGLRAMKDGSDARTQLELALVKAAVPKVDASAKALQSRLERLEAGRPAAPPAAGRAPSVPATAAGRAAPPANGAPTPAAPPSGERTAPSAPSRPPEGTAPPAPSRPAAPPAPSRPAEGTAPPANGAPSESAPPAPSRAAEPTRSARRRRPAPLQPAGGAGAPPLRFARARGDRGRGDRARRARRGADRGRGRPRPRRVRGAVAGRDRVDPGRAAAAGRAPQGGAADRARGRRAHARLGRDLRPLAPQGGGPAQPGADRPRDPRRHRRLAAARRTRCGPRRPARRLRRSRARS